MHRPTRIPKDRGTWEPVDTWTLKLPHGKFFAPRMSSLWIWSEWKLLWWWIQPNAMFGTNLWGGKQNHLASPQLSWDSKHSNFLVLATFFGILGRHSNLYLKLDRRGFKSNARTQCFRVGSGSTRGRQYSDWPHIAFHFFLILVYSGWLPVRSWRRRNHQIFSP